MAETKRDYFEVLGVPRTANDEEIKRAFRKLAVQFHPDLQEQENKKAAQERFMEVSEAYEILSDPIARRRYAQSAGVTLAHGAQRALLEFCQKTFRVEKEA